MFKKVLSLAVCLCMLLGAVSVVSNVTFAASANLEVSAVMGVSASYVEFTDGTSAITTMPAAGSSVTANVKISNNNASAQDVLLLVSVYSGNVLTKMEYTQAKIDAGVTNAPVSVSVAVPAGATSLKAHVWNAKDSNHAIAYPAIFPSNNTNVLAMELNGNRLDLSAGKTFNMAVAAGSKHDFKVVTEDNGTHVVYEAPNTSLVAPGPNTVKVVSSDGTADTYTFNFTAAAGKILGIDYTMLPDGYYNNAIDLIPYYGSNADHKYRTQGMVQPSFQQGAYLHSDRDTSWWINAPGEALYGKEYFALNLNDVRGGTEITDYMNGDNTYFTFEVTAPCEVIVLAPIPFPNYESRAEWVPVNSGTGITFPVTINGFTYNGKEDTRDKTIDPTDFYVTAPQYVAIKSQDAQTADELTYAYKLTVATPGTVTIPTWGDNTSGGGHRLQGSVIVNWLDGSGSVAPSTNANLSKIQYNKVGGETPGTGVVSAFAADTLSYTVEVPFGTTSVTLDAITADDGATVTYAPASLTNADLQGAGTAIVATVTAEDGIATKAYSVLFTEGTKTVLSSNKDLGTISYVVDGGAAVNVTPTGNASYDINLGPTATAVTSLTVTAADSAAQGVALSGVSFPITLTTAAQTATATVTAEDGTTKAYTFNFKKGALDADASITGAITYKLDGTSKTISGTSSPYSTTITLAELGTGAGVISDVTVTPTKSTSSVTSVTPATLNLTESDQAITVVVTAESGATTSYVFNFKKEGEIVPDDAAVLKTFGIEVNGTEFTVPGFAENKEELLQYNMTVGASDTVVVNPEAWGFDANDTIYIECTDMNAANEITNFPTTVFIVVTSKDGNTVNNYTITISKDTGSIPTFAATDATVAAAGDTFTVDLVLSDSPTNGLVAFTSGIVYDKTKFECIGEAINTSFVDAGGSTYPDSPQLTHLDYPNTHNKDFAAATFGYMKIPFAALVGNGTLATFTFRLKTGVTDGDYYMYTINGADTMDGLTYDPVSTKNIPAKITVGSGPAASTDATLATLTYDDGTGAKTVTGFSVGTALRAFTVQVEDTVTTVTIAATVADAAASIISGTGAISLTAGVGTTTVAVEAEDPTSTENYVITFEPKPVLPAGTITEITYSGLTAAGTDNPGDIIFAGSGVGQGTSVITDNPWSGIADDKAYKFPGLAVDDGLYSAMQFNDTTVAGEKVLFTFDLYLDCDPAAPPADGKAAIHFFVAARDNTVAVPADGLWKWNTYPRWMEFNTDQSIKVYGTALDAKWLPNELIKVELYMEPKLAPGDVTEGKMILALRGNMTDAAGNPITFAALEVQAEVPRKDNNWCNFNIRADEPSGSQNSAVYLDNMKTQIVGGYSLTKI